MALERPWIEKQVVLDRKGEFQTSLKPSLFTSGQSLEKAVQGKTNREHRFGHNKIAKNLQLLTLDSRIPAESCFEHENNRQKPPVFDVFLRFSLISFLEKTAVWGKTNREHNPQDTFGTPKNAKKTQFLTLDPRFPWEGCTRPKKIAKNHHFLTRQPDSLRGVHPTKKNRKNRKKPQFLTLDTHFP